jgi:hypothetical protein
MKQTTFLDARRDDAVRGLDPANKSLDDATQRRAAASLERIIAVPLHGEGPGKESLTRRRLWLVPGVAAAGLAVALVGPMLSHTEQPAFAWTNTPSPVNAHAAAQAAAACTGALRQSVAEDMTGGVPASIRPSINLAMVKLVVSERRGNHIFVALGQGQAAYSCLSLLTSPGQVQASGGGLPTPSTPALPLRSNDALADGYTTGTDNGHEYASMVGYAGQDVTGVIIRTGEQDIHASVANGYFAAWWPTSGPKASPTPAHGYTLTITLKNGTTSTASRDPSK